MERATAMRPNTCVLLMREWIMMLRSVCVLSFLAIPGVASCAESLEEETRFIPVSGSPFAVGPMAGKPEVGDVNGDGHLDIVVACGPCCGADPSPDSGHLTVLLGDGAGAFTNAAPIKIGPSALRCALGDLNNDSVLDVAVIEHNSYDITILLGRGDGTYDAAPASPLRACDGESPHTHAVTITDVNADGNADVLTTNVDDHSMGVLLGDGEGGFTRATGSPYFAGQHPYENLNVIDINGDSHVDVVLTNVRGNAITTMLGSGSGMFAYAPGFSLNAPESNIEIGERPMYCVVCDINKDGDPDVVAALDDYPTLVMLHGNGTGRFEIDRRPITVGSATVGLAVADIDGDGHDDIITGSQMESQASIVYGREDGTFSEPRMIDVGGHMPSQVVMADVNGDGKLDLITGNYGSGTVSVLVGQ